ncbi:MAG: lysophospholipid acyltransferase family protein [Candidatus Competibacteraceae bacterium]|nr:lysophospholipid acyltransferase family protein [Candidatus Competibacteraceae bacterium]
MSEPLRDYHPFTPADIQRAQRTIGPLLAPWRLLTEPLLIDLHHLRDAAPALLVGNHTLLGFMDAPLMAYEIHQRTGIYVRGLGDHIHFSLPGWGRFWHTMGIVDGTRDNCRRMMKAGETLCIFPGGAREAFKGKGEQYQLLWGERLGFARMAIGHGYPIVPFAAVGADDCFEIVLDRQDVLESPMGALMQSLGLRQDAIVPLLRGVGPSPFPRPQRFYFKFAPAIDTRDYGGDWENDTYCRQLRDQVKVAVETDIHQLLEIRQQDPHRRLLPRLLGGFSRRLTGARA